MMTTQKIVTGEFSVLWNGVDTGYRIVNGSAGLSGRSTQNVYGIVIPGQPAKWLGTIANCKKTLAFTFKKNPPAVAAPAPAPVKSVKQEVAEFFAEAAKIEWEAK